MLLDLVQYADFNTRAIEVSTKVLNFWGKMSLVYDDPAPIGTNYLWGYKPVDTLPEKAEDDTHLILDMRALESQRTAGMFHADDLKALATTVTHARYDFANFLPYSHMDRRYFLDGEGNPYDPGATLPNEASNGPELGDWVGEYASDVQIQLFAYKCLEVCGERLRLLENDISAYSFDNDNVLTTMGMLFQLHDLKLARQRLNRPADPSNAAPVIDPVAPVQVADGAIPGSSVTTISATDTDAGQTRMALS